MHWIDLKCESLNILLVQSSYTARYPVAPIEFAVQADWDCVEYPHGKGRKPRDPAEHILTYKMEEVADLLWVGGLAVTHASAPWRLAWSHLRAACEHYLFGFEATEAECRAANNRLYAYAECIEEAVIAGQVLHCLLR